MSEYTYHYAGGDSSSVHMLFGSPRLVHTTHTEAGPFGGCISAITQYVACSPEAQKEVRELLKVLNDDTAKDRQKLDALTKMLDILNKPAAEKPPQAT